MHYYQFNIGDYQSHTGHLEPLEDVAYRRMLDWCYLHERPLPDDIDQIAKLIRMRTHCDCIASVLREFFTKTPDGWWQDRIGKEISKASEKSEKAAQSAKARWGKGKVDANALPPQSERNATQDTIPITQDPKPKKKATSVAIVLEMPDWLPMDTWNEFVAMRNKIRKPMTAHAQKLMLGKLEQFMDKGYDIKVLLEASIVNCWQDVYEPNASGKKTGFVEQRKEMLRGLTSGLMGGDGNVKLIGS